MTRSLAARAARLAARAAPQDAANPLLRSRELRLEPAVEGAIEEGAREFDFLLGTEDYKRRFTYEARPGANVVLTPALRPISLLVAGEARARRFGGRLAERPGLGRVVRSLRGLLPTSRA